MGGKERRKRGRGEGGSRLERWHRQQSPSQARALAGPLLTFRIRRLMMDSAAKTRSPTADSSIFAQPQQHQQHPQPIIVPPASAAAAAAPSSSLPPSSGLSVRVCD